MDRSVSAHLLRLRLAEALTAPVRTLTPRDIRLPRIPGKAMAVIGVRRGGKTSFLQQQMADRLAAFCDGLDDAEQFVGVVETDDGDGTEFLERGDECGTAFAERGSVSGHGNLMEMNARSDASNVEVGGFEAGHEQVDDAEGDDVRQPAHDEDGRVVGTRADIHPWRSGTGSRRALRRRCRCPSPSRRRGAGKGRT